MEPKFDFNKYAKKIGRVSIFLTPTLHLAKSGSFTLYLTGEEDSACVKISRSGKFLGFKFIKEKDSSAYSIFPKGEALAIKAKRIGIDLKLDEMLGDKFRSMNFDLIHSEEDPHLWYCDLTQPTTLYDNK